MTATRDTWQLDAGHRLRQHLMRAVTKGKNFAPDQTYELSKAGQVGPKSAAIAEIFQHHADLWAQDARTCAAGGMGGPGEGFEFHHDCEEAWKSCMAEAELEVGRYLACHRLTTGHAA